MLQSRNTHALMPDLHHLPHAATSDPDTAREIDRCTVIVPCFNEEKRLQREAFHAFLERQHPVRLLFVNDGSTDGTLSVLTELQTAFPEQVDVLDKQPNGGKAEAVRAGMLHAVAHTPHGLVGFWDADLATPLDAILEMKRILDHRPQLEMVFGARVRLLGRSIKRKPARHYLGRIFATVVSTLLRVPIYDTQCGAKLFRVTPDLQHVLAQPFHSRWIFDVELLARFLDLHAHDPAYAPAAIYEFPLLVWHDVAGSRLRPGDFLRSIAELNHIRNIHLRASRSPPQN